MFEESQYLLSSDAAGNQLEGGRNYRLFLPPDIPASKFWSVIVYDKKTQLIIKNHQFWPSVFSTSKELVVNQDGSVDIWFGPKAPPGRENNWIRTITGKAWYMILRLYDAREPWINKAWQPGKIEEVNKSSSK